MLSSGVAAWSDPSVVEINRLPMRPALVTSRSLEATRAGRAARRLELNGVWRFKLFTSPLKVREGDLHRRSSSLGKTWKKVAVPGNWTLQDVGDHPHYTNIDMPFGGPPPRLPEHNPTGVYRRSFTLPASWKQHQVVLHLGAADSVHLVYLNRKSVGYGTDNRLASEYDISKFVQRGNNELAIVVVRYSAQSYVEDQDQWWMAGLHRSVFIEARSICHVRAISCTSDFDPDSRLGIASVEVDVAFTDRPRSGVSVQAWFEELTGKRVTQPVIQVIPHDFTQRYGFVGHKAVFRMEVPHARPWSAEDPHRYRLVVKLLGVEREFSSLVTGFR
ncbi:MAG: sugar-binding domain-containing protein, partial [Actinomycetota bacterium]